MATRKKAIKTVKKASAKKIAKKAAPKKALKKAAPKNSVTKKKASPKKSTASKKKAVATTRKPPGTAKKAATSGKRPPRKTATNSIVELKRNTAIKEKAVENITAANLPPVEEKSPAIQVTQPLIPAADIKFRQKARARNYDNQHIHLSSIRKGGIRPSGKKPLW